MSLFDRRTQVTAREFADVLYYATLKGMQELGDRLFKTCIGDELRERLNTVPQGDLEMLIFCMFPFEVIVIRKQAALTR